MELLIFQSIIKSDAQISIHNVVVKRNDDKPLVSKDNGSLTKITMKNQKRHL